jgi:hypothetical protein
MAFKMDEFIHDMFTNSTVKKVVQNPIITAIIIVILFVIIAHFMFHDDELEGWDWAKRLIKFGIYGAAVTIPVVFLHYKNSEDDYNKRVYGRSEQDLMREVEEVVQPVRPDSEPTGAAEMFEAGVKETQVETKTLAPVLSRPATEAPIAQAAPQVQVVVQAPQAPQPAPRSPARPVLKTPVSNKV